MSDFLDDISLENSVRTESLAAEHPRPEDMLPASPDEVTFEFITDSRDFQGLYARMQYALTSLRVDITVWDFDSKEYFGNKNPTMALVYNKVICAKIRHTGSAMRRIMVISRMLGIISREKDLRWFFIKRYYENSGVHDMGSLCYSSFLKSGDGSERFFRSNYSVATAVPANLIADALEEVSRKRPDMFEDPLLHPSEIKHIKYITYG